MNWPNKIYVATRNLGVYYTENLRTPEIQPIWYRINEGLPSLDIIEFHVDQASPEDRDNKDILYALLSNKSTIYRKVGTDPWRLYVSSYCIHGFEAVAGGGISYTYGARGVVDPVDPNYHISAGAYEHTDREHLCSYLGGDCYTCHPACLDYCADGSPTIWTYGCGSPRKGVYPFTLGMGAPGYVNLPKKSGNCVFCGALHIMWCDSHCHDDPCCEDPCPSCCGLCICPHPHLTWEGTGTGNWLAPLITTPYTDLLYTVHHPNLSGFYLAYATGEQCGPLNGIGSDSGYDSLWADPDDPTHLRLVSGGVINETRNGEWDTYTSGSVQGIGSIADWAGEDPDNIIAGKGSAGDIIGCLDGMGDTHFKSIAGAMRSTPPYTSSIPAAATGGIALGGLYPMPREPGGIRIYAVSMPYYKGDQRGRPVDGDRSGWNAIDYPDIHAKDLKDSTPMRHAPLPTGVGDVIYSTSGSTWDTYRLPSLAGFGYKETIFTFNGELSKKVGPFRLYNKLGVNQLVHKVALSVAAAPSGDDVVVDIRRHFSSFDTEGVSVWTPNNGAPGWEDVRPRISSGSYYGETSDVPTARGASANFVWGNGRGIRAEIANAGAVYGGAYLVVHIVHGDTAEEEPGFTAVTLKHAFLNVQPGTWKHAMIVGDYVLRATGQGGLSCSGDSCPPYGTWLDGMSLGYPSASNEPWEGDSWTEHGGYYDHEFTVPTNGLYEIIANGYGLIETIEHFMVARIPESSGSSFIGDTATGGYGDGAGNLAQWGDGYKPLYWHWIGNLTKGDIIKQWIKTNQNQPDFPADCVPFSIGNAEGMWIDGGVTYRNGAGYFIIRRLGNAI